MGDRIVYHSIKEGDGWVVMSEGILLSSHPTQAGSEAQVRRVCTTSRLKGVPCRALLHRSDGTVKEERLYGVVRSAAA